jgi:hypothetical protein
MRNRLTPKFNDRNEREAFWLQRCEEFISSGLSKARYCAERNINDSSLYRWLDNFKGMLDYSQPATRLNTATKMQKPALNKKLVSKAAFLPVQVKQIELLAAKNLATPTKGAVVARDIELPLAEIVFPNGLRLVINQAINADLLSQLMQAAG